MDWFMSKKGKIRVLIAKPGLDGHDRGAKVIARALWDSGMEVIYTGLRQSPEDIVEAAIQEDVHFIWLSILSGDHTHIFPRVIELLNEREASDIKIIAGGIIPDEEIPKWNEIGIKAIFGPGSSTNDIIDYIKGFANWTRMKLLIS